MVVNIPLHSMPVITQWAGHQAAVDDIINTRSAAHVEHSSADTYDIENLALTLMF